MKDIYTEKLFFQLHEVGNIKLTQLFSSLDNPRTFSNSISYLYYIKKVEKNDKITFSRFVSKVYEAPDILIQYFSDK